GATVNRTVPFRWKAMPYASAYEIQVAANEDTNFSNANLVVKTRSSKRPAWTNGIAEPGLTPSDNAYVWRVRRIESSGRTGDWSSIERFFVAAEHPTPLTPADAATVGPRALALSWDAVEGTSRHKV